MENFGIVEPYPKNVFLNEFTSAQITCVAFDSSGMKTPERVQFMRKDTHGNYTNITANSNLYFTNRTEEVDQGRYLSLKNAKYTRLMKSVPDSLRVETLLKRFW